MSTFAEAAADVFQAHRDELGFVNRAQCRDGDLVTVERDGEIVGALLGNHCVRKPQSTVYEMAVLPEYRREGIASELVARFADESPHEKLVAKCPVPLPANEFYQTTGWTLVDTEDGKKRALNVWRYDIYESPDLITTGRQDLTAIAEQYGWLRGTRLDDLGRYEKRGIAPQFIDVHWEDPDRAALLEACRRHRPRYAIAGDYDGENYDEINEFAADLRDHAENVIVVPHESGEVERVPEWAVVGYSSPTAYAGTDAPVWEYRGHDVHILGGQVNQIREIYSYLADDVVSIDTNSHHRGATMFAKWWAGNSPMWNKTANPIPSDENVQLAYENSLINIGYYLREQGVAGTAEETDL